jgi:hypothetical protein
MADDLEQRLRELLEAARMPELAVDPDDRDGMEWNDHIVHSADANMRVAFMSNALRSNERAALIVEAVNALPSLLDTIAALKREIEAMRVERVALIDSANFFARQSRIEDERALSAEAQLKQAVEALEWYASRVADCRKNHSEGETARQELDHDGGQIALATLATIQGQQP